VTLVRSDVSEEYIASIFRVIRIGDLGTLAVTSNRIFLRFVLRLLLTADVLSSSILVTLMVEAIRSSETSVLARVTPQKTEFFLKSLSLLRIFLFVASGYLGEKNV
jgi:hypothetical protein